MQKGVQFYMYRGGDDFAVEVQTPAHEKYEYGPKDAMVQADLEIGWSDIGLLEHTGRFQWTAKQNDIKLMHKFAEISPTTGNIGNSNMKVMLNTRSEIHSRYAISYGFYDAGPGLGGLTNHHQSYVYVTRNHARWMGDLVAANPRVGQRPFGTMVLPGAHDSGMFDPTTLDTLLRDAVFLAALTGVLGIVAAASVPEVRRAAINLSFTQKDDITTLLNLGVRFLDFRPGYVYKGLMKGIYHQHLLIPGYPFDRFLTDVFTWLNANPTEIVVVSLGFSGFKNHEMRPTEDVLTAAIAAAQEQAGAQAIVLGDKNDLATPLSTLLHHNKRLIFLNHIKSKNDASVYDSYSDEAYQTTDVRSILSALDGMTAVKQSDYNYTLLQLQGTATGASDGVILSSIATTSDATSPLLSTKAAFDHATYRWVKGYVPSRLRSDNLLVLLNDFTDNALTEHAIALTSTRAG